MTRCSLLVFRYRKRELQVEAELSSDVMHEERELERDCF